MGKKTVSKSKAKGKKDLPEEKTIEKDVISFSLYFDFFTEQQEFCHRINFLLDFLFWDDEVDLGDAFGAVDCARFIMRANEQKMDEYHKRSCQEKRN